jgi:hypothetical protein
MRHARVLLLLLAVAGAACGGSDGDEGIGSPTSPTTGGGSGCQRPSAPGNLTGVVSINTATFTWSPVNGANDYLVTVGPNPGTSSALSTNTTQTTYTWNAIPRGTYHARVEARNTCGSSGSSNEITITVVG